MKDWNGPQQLMREIQEGVEAIKAKRIARADAAEIRQHLVAGVRLYEAHAEHKKAEAVMQAAGVSPTRVPGLFAGDEPAHLRDLERAAE